MKVDFSSETVTGWKGKSFLLKWKIPEQRLRVPVAALILPGLHYTPDKPLLYYTAQALVQRGVAVAAAWVDYTVSEFQEADPRTRLQWLVADAEAALAALRRRGGVKSIVLVGKSIGTLTMASLWGMGRLADMTLSVWFTPLMAFPVVQQAALNLPSPALFIGSMQDSAYNAEGWQNAHSNPKIRTVLLERGDHSLEDPDDLRITLELHHSVFQELLGFLDSFSLIERGG